ncbi:GNVR domain-containing protein [Vibrio sp. HA2012]|uniref:GNVR domain-containing protein n=1 Tax=Vibrio sp. HA2012 TaxID=1971595 RepID=UPI003FCC9265
MIASQVDADESLLRGISIAFDKWEQLITVSKTSASPDEAFQSVELVYQNLNAILKQVMLAGVSSAVDSAASLENAHVSGKVQESVAEIYAQQLYKKAVLENPSSELIQVVSPPVKPTSHIKPKRALICVLGTLLGGMLGVAMVLIRFAFRREE